jgi:polyferredoxin
MWQCPLGSLQEIAGKCVKYKLKISGKVQKYLNYFHDGLWIVLMLFLMTGIWSDWIGYELFTAFMFQQASWIIVAVAVFFVIMSFFVQRPYCRYICPTGNLFQLIQNKK